MQRGQKIFTLQSRQTVHPAKSHSRMVCPKTAQSFSVIEYGVADCRGMSLVFLRRLGIFSPHRSTVTVSLLLSLRNRTTVEAYRREYKIFHTIGQP